MGGSASKSKGRKSTPVHDALMQALCNPTDTHTHGPIPIPPLIRMIASYAEGFPRTVRVASGSVDGDFGETDEIGFKARYNEPFACVLWQPFSEGAERKRKEDEAVAAAGRDPTAKKVAVHKTAAEREEAELDEANASITNGGYLLVVSEPRTHQLRGLALDTCRLGTLQHHGGRVPELTFPTGLTIDPLTNTLLITECRTVNRVRRITIHDTVELVAGGIGAGYADGVKGDAKFDSPVSIVCSSDGKAAYVADSGNSRIRKIDLLSGAVSPCAGAGNVAVKDGSALTEAAFHTPSALVLHTPSAFSSIPVDSVLYAIDGKYIRKIDLAKQTVITLAIHKFGQNMSQLLFLPPNQLIVSTAAAAPTRFGTKNGGTESKMWNGGGASALWLVDTDNGEMHSYSAGLAVDNETGESADGRTRGTFDSITGMCMKLPLHASGDDRIFVVDQRQHHIKVIAGTLFGADH